MLSSTTLRRRLRVRRPNRRQAESFVEAVSLKLIPPSKYPLPCTPSRAYAPG